jgi:anaphase-promoting complex subunit 1
MASVTSLGLHRPTALPYLIQERLLPVDPPTNSYTLQATIRNDEEGSGEDELITTKTSVIWCRGGVVRKSFRFEIEGEPVTRAILTTFRGDRPKRNASKDNVPSKSSRQEKAERYTVKQHSKAIVVFLRTQAHVYFLTGTTHVIHLPFEVEYAIAAPNGLIIQRKVQAEKVATTSLKFQRVPPNSFISSQVQPWSAASSQHSNFSTASLGSPQQLPLPDISTFGDAWGLPALKDDSKWPRLFSLTDPLAEMGLVVTAPKSGFTRRRPLKLQTLDPAEEIIHTTVQDEFALVTGDDLEPLVLAVTLNRETSMYTVWLMTYVDPDGPERSKHHGAGGATSRRRSSFAPGTTTGAATPVPFRESIGPAGLNLSKIVSRKEENAGDEKLDFVSALDPDFEISGAPKRKSRRVSSMLARADLSASHERSAFSDLATGHHHSNNRRGESLGSQHTRNSMNFQTSLNGHSQMLPPPNFEISIGSFLEAPVDNLLEELRAGGDFEGFNSMGLDDDDFDGLRKEVTFTKIESVPVEQTTLRYSSQTKPAQSQCKTFTLAAPPCSTEDSLKTQIVICILDPQEKRLLVLTFNIKTHDKPEGPAISRKAAPSAKETLVVVTFDKVIQAKGVLDACKVTDGDVSRILILTESTNGFGDLTLQAPWSALMKVNLPSNLTVNNPRSVAQDLTPQKTREGGLKRVLSHRPRSLLSLSNPLPHGMVDVTDDGGYSHQLCIRMEPRTPLIKQAIDTIRYVLPGNRGGESFLVGWWNARQWLENASGDETELEWTSFVILLFAAVVGARRSHSSPAKTKSSRSFLRSSSGAQSDTTNWQAMMAQETAVGASRPQWMTSSAWAWVGDAESEITQTSRRESNRSTRQATPQIFDDEEKFLPRHIRLAQDFASSELGQAALGPTGYLPTASNRDAENKNQVLTSIMVGLHLLREEQKLDVTSVDSIDTGNPSLLPILAQISSWLGWDTWVSLYQVEDVAMGTINIDPCKSHYLPCCTLANKLH